MMTWKVKFEGRDRKEGIAVVTADSVAVGVAWIRKKLAESGIPQEIRNEQFIPMVTGSRHVRILSGV
jgi:hypothetical protein